jgi:hypothetical protein
MAAKSQDLNTALIFLFFFIKEKEPYRTMPSHSKSVSGSWLKPNPKFGLNQVALIGKSAQSQPTNAPKECRKRTTEDRPYSNSDFAALEAGASAHV